MAASYARGLSGIGYAALRDENGATPVTLNSMSKKVGALFLLVCGFGEGDGAGVARGCT